MLSVQLNVAVLTREFRISSRNEKRRIVPSPFARRQFSLVLFFPPLVRSTLRFLSRGQLSSSTRQGRSSWKSGKTANVYRETSSTLFFFSSFLIKYPRARTHAHELALFLSLSVSSFLSRSIFDVQRYAALFLIFTINSQQVDFFSLTLSCLKYCTSNTSPKRKTKMKRRKSVYCTVYTVLH